MTENKKDFGHVVECLTSSLISLWIIIACMIGEWATPSSVSSSPSIAIIIGAPAMLLVFPAFFVLVCGVAGGPLDSIETIYQIFTALWPLDDGKPRSPIFMPLYWAQDFFASFKQFAITVYKLFVPHFFAYNDIFKESSYAVLPAFIRDKLWVIFKEPCKLYEGPGDIGDQVVNVDNETWIFINGVATTKAIAKQNCMMLNSMFGRKVLLCHNPTESVLVDLLNCLNGKIRLFDWLWKPEARPLLVKTLRDKLKDAKAKGFTRVVLIAHSQGTIITSNALEQLSKDPADQKLMEELLEVYAFANCAHNICWSHIRYQENISNQFDVVAWLGDLFPFPSFWKDSRGNPMKRFQVDSKHKSLIEERFWGHLLNSHYLIEMNRGAYKGSQLHSYMGGKTK